MSADCVPRGQVQHTPSSLPGLVTCTVGGGEGRNKLRRATVQLPNTATFGELLASAREQRHGALEFEGPVYGGDGELETTLVDAWVRDGCKVDGTRHIGLAVIVSFPLGSQLPLCLTMAPGDTINEVKQVWWLQFTAFWFWRAPNISTTFLSTVACIEAMRCDGETRLGLCVLYTRCVYII